MKQILMGGLLVSLAVCNLSAKKPTTRIEGRHPVTSVAVMQPMTNVNVEHPTTSVEVLHETTHTEVFHSKTNVPTIHPATQVQVVHPQTTVQVIHPQTNVEVIHPQTTVEVFHPQTPVEGSADSGAETKSFTALKGGGVKSSAQATTSMSDFKPMQAKNLSAKPSMDKAAPLSGGSNNLGNTTNESEKDNANKSSLLGIQKTAENIEVDPKQNKLEGLEKLLTDRTKFKEKK